MNSLSRNPDPGNSAWLEKGEGLENVAAKDGPICMQLLTGRKDVDPTL